MKNKKGQVTIFIIIGILIVAGVILYFTLRKETTDFTTEEVSTEVRPIQTYVQNCIDEISQETILIVASRGGYYDSPNLSISEFKIPYYLIEKKEYVPSISEIEKEISKGVEIKLTECVGDFSEFNEYKIKKSKVYANTKIGSEEITINVKYPISIQKGGELYNLKNFETEKKSRFKQFYESISYYIEEEKKSGDGICVSCLANTSSTYDLDYNSLLLNAEESEMAFMVSEHNEEINNNSMIYTFAVKY
jgi:hypothetical protein